VTLQARNGQQPARSQSFTIVGVDEASVAEGRVAFVAPIARALLGARLGQTIALRTGRGEETAQVAAIAYGASDNLVEENAEK
jgi:transcription elongation factor GreB